MDYNELFNNLFSELRKYWLENSPNQLIFNDNEEKLSFKFLDDIKNPIVFFDIPFNHLSFYRDYIFPPIKEFGFIPIVESDISLISKEINLSKIFTIIEKAYIVILDYSTSKWRNYIIKTTKSKNIIYVVEEKLDLKLNFVNIKIINRPKEMDIYSSNINEFIKSLTEEIKSYSEAKDFQYDFEKLFANNHYEAAVVFAFKNLEVKLNEFIKPPRFKPWFSLFEEIKDYIPDVYNVIRSDYRPIRNKIVHENFQVPKQTAQKIIDDIKYVIEIIDEISIKDTIPELKESEFEKVEEEQKEEIEFFKRNNIPDKIKTLFYNLKLKIKDIDKNIWLKVAKTAITFYDQRMFIYMVPQKKSLLITLPLKLSDSEMLIERGGGKSWPGIKVTEEAQILKTIQLIEKAYKIRGQTIE